MWFKFPVGVTAVQVALQNFVPEAKTDRGLFFRAPDHFAATLLSIPGFTVEAPEDTDLDDLPVANPDTDGALASLAAQVTALQEQVTDGNLEIQRLNAALGALANERDQLKLAGADAAGKYGEVRTEYDALIQRLTDAGIDPVAPKAQDPATAGDKAEDPAKTSTKK